jgi:ribonuclease BN (tRNA processing enzyme)
VILSNGVAYVIDCGLDVTDQFAYTGIPFGSMRSIFITHHHPDHNVEYGPFLVIGWIQGLQPSVQAFGPPPLKQMTEDLFARVQNDERLLGLCRRSQQRLPWKEMLGLGDRWLPRPCVLHPYPVPCFAASHPR